MASCRVLRSPVVFKWRPVNKGERPQRSKKEGRGLLTNGREGAACVGLVLLGFFSNDVPAPFPSFLYLVFPRVWLLALFKKRENAKKKKQNL